MAASTRRGTCRRNCYLRPKDKRLPGLNPNLFCFIEIQEEQGMSILAIIATTSTLIAQADEVGLAYVDCMFTTARTSPAELASNELSVLLRESCVDERGALRTLVIEIRQQQGISARQAELDWSRVESDSINSILRARRGRIARSG